jgi:uncharacterized protein YgiM (DUF1202 family)
MNSFTNFRRYPQWLLSVCLAAGLPLVAQADSLKEPGPGPAPAPTTAPPVLKASSEGQTALPSPALAVGNHGVVKGTRSNVRTRPSLAAEAVIQLNKGDAVTIVEHKMVSGTGKDMEWLRIQLPAQAKCFVNAQLVSDGVVKADSVYVRHGPSTNHRDVGKLVKGDHVEVVKTESGWLQIKPTPQCTGWIAAELVEITPAPAIPEVTPTPAPVITEPPTTTTATPATTIKVVDADPDVIVQYVLKDGILQAATEAGALAPHQLMTPELNRLQQRMCYIESDHTDLSRFEGKHVRVAGNERWRKGDRYPVLVLDRIGMVW